MAKVIINVPLSVEADVRSVPNNEESVFGLDKTDVVQLTNITVPGKLTLAAANVVLVEDADPANTDKQG